MPFGSGNVGVIEEELRRIEKEIGRIEEEIRRIGAAVTKLTGMVYGT